MPRYDFHCPGCGTAIELQRTVDERDDLFICSCGVAMERAYPPARTGGWVLGFSGTVDKLENWSPKRR